jgi:DNA-binding transcriptional MerR regulator
MFRIGEFSRLGGVTVKTLHHYDEMGLLRPALVDRCTGYRHYTADQLTTLHRILTLKGLGFSLQEIADVLGDAHASVSIEDILRKKIEEARQTVSREQVRIAQTEAWLRYTQEDVMPEYDVLLKTLEPQLVASIRERMHDSAREGALFSEVAEYIESQGAKGAGPGLVLLHDTESTEEGFDAEAAYPISTALAGTERIRVYELPRVESAACLVYKGADEGMGGASRVIAKWIEDNGYRISGPNRIVFLHCGDDKSGTGEWVVETQFPVEKA